MIRTFTAENSYGGKTYEIEIDTLFRLLINETNTSSFVVEFKEHMWINKKTRFSFVSERDLIQTIKDAFEKVFDYFSSRDDYMWTIEQKNTKLDFALRYLSKYS
jgi:hypothetical protein